MQKFEYVIISLFINKNQINAHDVLTAKNLLFLSSMVSSVIRILNYLLLVALVDFMNSFLQNAKQIIINYYLSINV